MKGKSAAPLLTHEFNSKSEHRIVVFTDGKADVGEWAPYEGIAQHGALRAGTLYHQGLLPIGVFTCKKLDSTHLE